MSLLGVMPFAEFVLLVSFLSASHGFVHNSRASSSTLSKSDSAHSRVSLLGDEKYFVQPVDHFNYITDHLWDQRFFIKDSSFKKGGPLFFYTGNEGPIEEFMDNSGSIFALAEVFNALVVFAEHRYYGKSLPFGDNSFEKENLGLLSVEQALADYAVLVQYFKDQYSIKKVISFGGSYGGMLSVWFRFKYPNIVDGALAASAPIYFIDQGIVPRTAFFQRVTEDFANVDSRCPQYVREAYSMIIELAKNGDEGLHDITHAFSLCTPLTRDKVDHLIGWIRNSFTSLAMVDYPYPASFLAPLPAYPVTVACQSLLKEKNRMRGLAQAAGLFYNGTNGTLSCFNIAEEFIECADPTGCGTGPAAAAWDYQACTEMSLPCDTNNMTDMFPPSVFDPTQHCFQKFGITPENRLNRMNWTNVQYWGKDILSASNIIFSNGNLDPWSTGGVQTSLSDSLIAIMIDGGAHHLDLRPANPKDPPSVVQARQQEMRTIAKWIQ